MKPSIIIAAAGTWLALVAFVCLNFQRTVLQREEISVERAIGVRLGTKLRLVGNKQESLAKDLTQAQQELVHLEGADQIKDQKAKRREAEIDEWLARLRELKNHFQKNPDQDIPEMRLLTLEDWLKVSRNGRSSLGKEQRRAAADVRTEAVLKFAPQLSTAIRKFAGEHPGVRPNSIAELEPYFDRTDLETLRRYEIIDPPRGVSIRGLNSATQGFGWGIQNKFPVDADYDTRLQVYVAANSSGMRTTAGPIAWEPGLRERLEAAVKAFAKDNLGQRPRSVADSFPYFSPPLPADLAERLVRTERK